MKVVKLHVSLGIRYPKFNDKEYTQAPLSKEVAWWCKDHLVYLVLHNFEVQTSKQGNWY